MNKDNGGPAFPVASTVVMAEGMTLRDYFAAKAMQGFCADPGTVGTPQVDVAEYAYRMADAMLAERAK